MDFVQAKTEIILERYEGRDGLKPRIDEDLSRRDVGLSRKDGGQDKALPGTSKCRN
jgi:hypothetical protein